MAEAMNLTDRLASRELVHPSELDHALETRARMHRAGAPYSPVYPTLGRLFPGTYYLNGIDAKWARSYSRVPLDAQMDKPGAPLAPPIVLRLEKRDEVSCPVTGKLRVLSDSEELGTDLHAEAKRRIACVITGTSAGLPGGGDGPVFRPDNLGRLVRGDNCIAPISGQTKAELIDKNVVQLRKMPDGTRKRFPVDNQDEIIKVAAQLGTIDLTASYASHRALPRRWTLPLRWPWRPVWRLSNRQDLSAASPTIPRSGFYPSSIVTRPEWCMPRASRPWMPPLGRSCDFSRARRSEPPIR